MEKTYYYIHSECTGNVNDCPESRDGNPCGICPKCCYQVARTTVERMNPNFMDSETEARNKLEEMKRENPNILTRDWVFE